MNDGEKNNEKWLLDAEVKHRITHDKGRWHVELIFIDTTDPTHFLVKRIADFRTERLAEINATYMVQTAAKDIRGTRKVNEDDYNINNN